MTYAQLLLAVAAGFVGLAFVTDVGNGSIWVSDGIRARPMNGEVSLYNNGNTRPTFTNTAGVVVIPVALPVGIWANGDMIEVQCDVSKSGATDAATLQVCLGTSSGVVGTQIGASNMTLLAASRRGFARWRFVRFSSTSIGLLNSAAGGEGGLSTVLATTTVSDMDAAVRYLQIIASTGATDTTTVDKVIYKLVT